MMALIATAMFVVAGAIVLLHLGFSPVLTGSMRGAFDAGALILTRPIPVAQVRVGDVVLFQPPGHSELFSHRVVSITPDEAGPIITTKGDANPVPDSWRARLTGPTASKVIFSLPHLGEMLLAVRRPPHRTLLLLLASAGITTVISRAFLTRFKALRAL